MQNSKSKWRIDFFSYRKIAYALSSVLILISVAALAIKGLNFGLDFTGGVEVEVSFEQAPELQTIRDALQSSGLIGGKVVNFGDLQTALISIPPLPDVAPSEVSSLVVSTLQGLDFGEPTLRRVDSVGPQVGDELRDQGGMAVVFALFGIVVYIWLRFERKFALGSVLALAHDVLITLGFFSLTAIAFDLSVLAAILAVIGYSLNDTIVVFDRIRETFLAQRELDPEQVMNEAVNDTLSRTIITSLTTLLVLLALYFVGGPSVHSFSIALILGVVVGTYSSIFIASAIVLSLGISREDMVPQERAEDAEEYMP